MRNTLLLMFITAFHAYAIDSYSQNTKLSLNLNNVPVASVLEEIQNNSEFYFLFNAKLIDVEKNVSISVKDEKISEILASLFSGTGVNYLVYDRQIILSKSDLKTLFDEIPQQKQLVTGKVTDSQTGEVMPGVNIQAQGTSTGVITDANGMYSISVNDPNATLVFSFIGYTAQEIPLNGRSILDVALASQITGLEEVIVIGYGTMRKSDLTGSIVSVKSDDLLERPSTNLGQALQGKAPGLLVRNISSAPGGEVSIIIRGNNSLNSGSEVLYIVDGIPLSSINTIPVEDIQSVEVLKDASSTAIYGSRGANGVILITTKKGRANAKPEISYSTRFTMENIPTSLNLMNGEEFATFYNEWELAKTPGKDPATVRYNGSSADRPTPSEAGEGTDWFDEITRTGMIQNHVLSVNGGSEKSTYAMSASYLDHKGLVISGQYNRVNIKSAITSNITDWLDTGLELFLSHNIKTNSGENTNMEQTGGIINQAIKMSPITPVYTDDGDYHINDLPGTQTIENPVAQAKEVEDFQRMNKAFGSIFLNVKPVKDLSIKFSVGGDLQNVKYYFYNPVTTHYGRLTNGSASLTVNDNTYIINENTVSYKKTFGIHKLDLVGGFTYEQQVYESLGGSGKNFYTDAFLYNNLASANAFDPPMSDKTKWSLASGLGRINYVLADKYLFTLTGRYDGSSRFGEGNKWGFFPSVAGAWRFSEEDFMKDLKWLSYGKIRVSWGETGNQNIGLYNSQAIYGVANYNFGEKIVSGVAATRLANKDLKWETTQSLDIGVDIGLFDRLMLNIDYYQKKTKDLLLAEALIETSGFSSATTNVGELENKGWEFSVDAKISDQKIKWNALASVFLNRNKITKLTDPTQEWKIGYPVGATRGYVLDGIIRTQADLDTYSDPNGNPISGAKLGDIRRVDLNGDYKITGEDQEIDFNPEPDFSFSLNNEISWKDLTFSMFLYGSVGGQIKNVTKDYMVNVLNVRNNISRELLSIENGVVTRNYWTPDNPDAKYQRLGGNSYAAPIEDGSFLRIQNVMLSYNFPLEKVFSRSSIYFSIQNLHNFTKYSGWDPDVSSDHTNYSYGVDRASHPVPRSYTFGLNITF